MTGGPSTIELGPFYKGAATASRVKDAHSGIDFPDEYSRLTTFWAFVGAVGAKEFDLEGDGLTEFLVGAATVVGRPGFWMAFDTYDAAFDDGEGTEVQRILHSVAESVGYGRDTGKVVDINGHTVGEWHLT